MPSILIVIPALNEAPAIEACLRSLIEADETAHAAEVIVMDGGSRDETCAIVERFAGEFANVRLVHNPRRTQAAAVNCAARIYGEGREVLIRCDAHARYQPHYITDLAAALARTGADSVVVPMDAQGQSCFQRAVAWIVDTPLGSGGAAHRGGTRSGYVKHGHHAAFRMARFLELGGYDESFTHNEDAEYDQRVIAAGGAIWLDANIRVSYFPRGSFAGLWRQYWNYGAGRARMLAKHKLRPAPRQLIPVLNLALLGGSLLLAPFAPLLSLVWPCAYACLVLAASLFVAATKKSLCGLLSGPALATMHLAWAMSYIVQTLKPQRPV